MMKRLFALAFLAVTPALAQEKTLESPLMACKSITDFDYLMTLVGQDKAAAGQFFRQKANSGECGHIPSGRVFVMEDMEFRHGDYACVRHNSWIECLWTLNIKYMK